MANLTPSKMRRIGRERFDPQSTFEETFAREIARNRITASNYRDGWNEAARTYKEEAAVTRERRIADEEVEQAESDLRERLAASGVDNAHTIVEAVTTLVEALLQRGRTF